MTPEDYTSKDRRRAATLAAIILTQALAAIYFIIDVAADFNASAGYERLHLTIEALASAALVAGVLLMMRELRALAERMAQMDRGLQAARGDMAGLIDRFFERWGLTRSERDVALLILKGFDNDAIAGLRGVAPGTIRAQSARIYAKAGVSGRAQLFSIFMEELLAGPES